MNKLLIMIACTAFLVACSNEKEEDVNQPVNEEVKKELKEVEDLNVELEKIDGEIDSLLNTLE